MKSTPCFLLILFVAVMVCGQDAVASDSTGFRPVTDGIALAYPKPAILALPPTLTEGLGYEIRVGMAVAVSTEGAVKGIKIDFAGDSLWLPVLDSLLKKITFVPGIRDGKPVAQTIPAYGRVRPGSKFLQLSTPVSDSGMIESAAWYTEALEINGLKLPRLLQVPSYFCPLSPNDSLKVLPSILLKVAVNKAGRPHSISVVRSGLPALTEQIVSATNWSSYAVTIADSKSGPVEFFLAYTFHPAAKYPTSPRGPKDIATRSEIEKSLLQVFADTLGLMVLPLPKQLNCDSTVVGDALNRNYGRISVLLGIDTTGSAQIWRVSRLEPVVFDLVKRTVDQISFYPAQGFDGRPRPFVGLMHLDFEGSTIIRIHLDWLQNRSSEPVR